MPTYSDPKLNRSGNYHVTYVEPHAEPGRPMVTRTVSLGTKDQAEAWRRRAQLIEADAAVGGAVAVVEQKTYGNLFDLYRDEVAAPLGMKTQLLNIEKLRPAFGHIVLGTLTRGDVSKFIRDRRATLYRGAPPSDGAIRRILNVLVAVQGWAVKNHEWPEGMTVPKITLPADSQPRDIFLPGHIAEHVWDYAFRHYMASNTDRRERIYLFVLLAMATAARSGAIEDLTCKRVNLSTGLIDFRNPLKRATKKRRSIVPIADRLRPVIEVALQRAHARGVPSEGPILGKWSSTEKQWRNFARDAGIPGIHRHDLRRTFGVLAAQDGVPLYDIAGVLGDTLATTEKHYAHHQPDHLRNAVNSRKGRPVETINVPFGSHEQPQLAAISERKIANA